MDEQVMQTAPETVEQVQVQEQPQITDKREANFAALRKKIEAEEAARIAAERKLAEYERMLQQQQPQQAQQLSLVPEEDEDLGDPDGYVEVKQVKRINKKNKSEIAELRKEMAEIREQNQRLQAQTTTSMLKNFNEVCSDDNIATLARLYPEEYNTMMMNPSYASRAKIAYNMISNYGIVDTKVKESDERIAKNRSKPGAAALGAPQTPQTPLTKLNDYERRVMTEERRAQILRRAQQIKDMY